jgi:hypothetical protein
MASPISRAPDDAIRRGLPLPDERSSWAIMCGKFESRFKRRDESRVNASLSRGRGKLALSTQMPKRLGFPHFAHLALTVAISFPITIAACCTRRPSGRRGAPSLALPGRQKPLLARAHRIQSPVDLP